MDANNIEVEFVDDEAATVANADDNNVWQSSSSSSHVGTIVEADTHPSHIETDYAMKRSRSDIPNGGEDDEAPVAAAARPLTRMNSITKKTLMFGLAALAAIIFISVGAGYMSSSKSNDTTKVSSASMAAPWVEDDSEGYAPYATVTRSNPTSKGSKMMHGNVKEDNCSSGKSGKSNSTTTTGGGGGKSGKSNSRRLRQQQQRLLSGKSGGKSKKKTGCSTKSAKKSKGGSKGSKGRRL